WGLTKRDRFDVVHRVTPSWIGNASLLPAMRVPYLIGPLLASDPLPQAFAPYLTRAGTSPAPRRWHPSRLAAGLAWRARNGLARRNYHLASAQRILVGTEIALGQVPRRYRSRCVPVPYSGVEHETFTPPP